MKTKSQKRKSKKRPNRKHRRPIRRPILCEAEVPIGLEAVSLLEMRRLLGGRMELVIAEEQLDGTGAIPFSYSGQLDVLFQLKTILAVYTVMQFDFARPTGLLAHEPMQKIVLQLKQAIGLWPPGAFETIGISAAGSDSETMVRLHQELADAVGLKAQAEQVDMSLRIRRTVNQLPPDIEYVDVPVVQARGWEVLIRLSPRPLSVRFWRVANMAGALNASVAHCMILLTHPKSDEVFLNLMCGSGTLLVERMAHSIPRRAIGCDINTGARAHAEQNLGAAGLKHFVELQSWDVRHLHLPDSKVDAIVADLPFGIAVGTHEENILAYPDMLAEAARVAKPHARFVAMTQEIRLFEKLIEQSDAWSLEKTIRLEMRGLHQRIYVLRRYERS